MAGRKSGRFTRRVMRDFTNAKKIVIKVGTSTLTFANGSLNLKRIEELTRVITDLKNSGKEVILVSSGAIGVGISRLRLGEKPQDSPSKQALAAVGQCQLMAIYDEFFRKYNQIVGQVLLTKEVVTNEKMHTNAVNTFVRLLSYDVIPVVNENDTISTDEIEFGDNDTLSAHVANIVGADLLIMLTDIDGLYDKNPAKQDAMLISEVVEITDKIRKNAGGAGSTLGKGGMQTKVLAAEIAAKSNTETIIISGEKPSLMYKIFENAQVGTHFNLNGA